MGIREEKRFKKNKYLNKIDYCEIHVCDENEEVVGVIKIDNDMIPFCRNYTWRIKDGYAVSTIKGKFTPLHHVVFGELQDNNNHRDHINKDSLDNRRSNLREVSRSINATNAKPRSESSTGLRGVMLVDHRDKEPGRRKYCWYAEWSEDGVRKTKTFNINKYGFEEAKRLAIEFREEMLRKMKI